MRLFAIAIATVLIAAAPPSSTQPVVLSDDGGWCWFQDPRAIVLDENRLIVGSVANGRSDPDRKGDIEALVFDRASGKTTRVELHDRLGADDHNVPAFLVRPDGRLLTFYAKHGAEARAYYRISEPNDPTRWGPIRTFEPSPKTRLTYSNLYRLPAENGRVYDFFRGLNASFKPSYAYSDDEGETWTTGSVIIRSPAARPYVRYASDGRGSIHLLYTEGHPKDFDNSLYHVVYRDGQLRRSDGTPIRPLAEGLNDPAEGVRIFQGDADHVAWCSDIKLDADKRPVAVYSVQVGSGDAPPGKAGDDLRYRYARFDGERWADEPLAFAGERLYAGEDDYSGLVSIDPDDVRVVYFSTNADPERGTPLKSAADGKRHYEIFRGVTDDGGASWAFEPITRDSTADNLRPIIPARGPGGWTALLWLRGAYRAYTDYDQEVVALPLGVGDPSGRR